MTFPVLFFVGEGGAPRSESWITMIAGGNHTIIFTDPPSTFHPRICTENMKPLCNCGVKGGMNSAPTGSLNTVGEGLDPPSTFRLPTCSE